MGLVLVCTLNSGRVGHTGICLGNDEAKGDVLFIFDTSGSMGEAGGVDANGNVLSKLQVARLNFAPRLVRAIRHAGGTGKFAALVLGRSPRCSEPKREVEWGAADDKVAEINALLNGLKPDDMTPLVRAFQIARDELRDKDNPGIVLVSDGLETCQKPPKDNFVELKKEAAEFGALKALGKLPGIYVVFFVPTLQPRPGTALAGALRELLNKLESVGRNMKAKMIALVNTVEGFGEALEGAVVEALDPAPARLGRLHSTKDSGDLLRVSVYISDDTTISDQNNSDGIIDKGETVQIGFRFRNISTTDLKNFELDNIKTDTSSIVPQKMQRPLLGNLDANK
ncbi:VWA domain-containing protein, partial [Candidatus Bipolaricaulota bacterium]|nr:VWA domain-containing protein [Candidatus Bipolaricaulota bacterium]